MKDMSDKLEELKRVFDQKTKEHPVEHREGDVLGWFEFNTKIKGVERFQTTYVELKLTKELFASEFNGCRDITFIQRNGSAKLSFELRGEWERQSLIEELKVLIKQLECSSE